jgi:hypothetical protein
MGATSIWERWDALAPDGSIYDPEMNSYNHYAYGAVCQWLMEGVAGLTPDPERPGFAGVILNPVIIPELGPVAASHDGIRGRIAAGWQLEGDRVIYSVTLPEGCEGRFVTDGRAGGAEPTTLTTRLLVTAPGLQAQEVVALVEGFPAEDIPRRHLGKGIYFRLAAKAPFERGLVDEQLAALVAALSGVAKASCRRGMSIVSLICNVRRTSEILERVFRVLGREGVTVQMMSQGASKTNIALVVTDAEAKHALRALHREFFEQK